MDIATVGNQNHRPQTSATNHTYNKVWVSVKKYLCMHTLIEN
jgi:hypothetical protein